MLLCVTLGVKSQQTEEYLALNTTTNVVQENKIYLNLNKVDYRLVPPPPPNRSGNTYGNQTGVGLTIAGTAFMITGLATSTEWYGTSGGNKKFFENPARAAAIISGGVLLMSGFIVSISN